MDKENTTQESTKQAVVKQGDIVTAIIKAASDPTIDISKLEKLIAFKERIDAVEAKKAFTKDFIEMKPHLPVVIKTKENTFTRSKYAPLEEINLSIDPILARFGFATATKITHQTQDTVTVEAQLWHKSGHVETTSVTMPLDIKSARDTIQKTLPHATSSSITYAKRISICALLNISTGDDTDGVIEIDDIYITIEQAAAIDSLIRETGVDREKVLTFAGADRNEEGELDVRLIRKENYKKVMAALSSKKREKK